jgi:7,8-dihydropterin-6-yl-methyl-4-(beta-D-ribofuranosyl)aminobenzene 5'-phosphate synthase
VSLGLCLLSIGWLAEGAIAVEARPLRITVIYNNVPHGVGMKTAWGFAALIETGSATVLFDTGGDGAMLLANMKRVGVEPGRVSAVVLSHIHADHTGGLDDLLAQAPTVTVYVPRSFPASFVRAVEGRGASVERVGGPQRLFANLYSTGEMGDGPKEQALIIETPAGLVVVTGCAHPGIVAVAAAARRQRGNDIYLLMGGFHLGGYGTAEVAETVRALAELGVRKVAPSHCTGEEAIALFRSAWGSDFIEGGCGAVIEVP